jgi:hypothetical protein
VSACAHQIKRDEKNQGEVWRIVLLQRKTINLDKISSKNSPIEDIEEEEATGSLGQLTGKCSDTVGQRAL